MSLLKQINDTSALRKLNSQELQKYVQEVRSYLIDVMSEVGGHVAANLGVVELTAALHYVFETPQDKIVWDVGHQTYAHKVMTGRRDQFPTIRKENGLSGFTKISESLHDAFGAGHSSTSISAGIGLAEAEVQKGTNHKIISVIGDGALTAGLAFEALNYAGDLRRPNFLVVLNDNEMSISENVGALRGSLKNFFESLGFQYFAPIDGHNLPELVSAFERAKKLSDEAIASGKPMAPLLIHVKTKKGHGLASAEEKPEAFHGITGFDKSTGVPYKKISKAPTYTSIFAKTLSQIAEKDKDIVAVTAAMTDGTGLSEFQKLYPKRFYDVGIAEQHAVTFASALRLGGLRPAVAIYSTFMQRAYDQVIHDAATQKIPLALFLDRAGLVGADGPTHHGVFDLSYLRCIPEMHIMAPKDENELQHMVHTALYADKLMAVRFPRGESRGVTLDAKIKSFPIGKAERIIDTEKPQVAIWAAGSCVSPAEEAAVILAKSGIPTSLVNARFIKPLDSEALIADAKKVSLIVSIEENSVVGGLGAAVLESLAKENLSIPVLNLGVPDEFISHGSQESLRKFCGLDAAGIVQAIRARL